MSVTREEGGTLVITGETDVQAYRLLVFRKVMQLEIKTGIKAFRGQNIFKVVRQQFNIEAKKKANVLTAFETILREKGILVDG